jgi:predicted GIY-YIG superfamily endonuclease
MTYPNQPGIYCFYNLVSNKLYVGSAKNLQTRIKHHIRNKNSNKLLQCSIKHHGLENFSINYWVLNSHEEALAEEQKWLDWIFNNNIKTFNLSISVKNPVLSDYSNHQSISEAGGSCKAKEVYALNIVTEEILYFSSRVNASKYLLVGRSRVNGGVKSKRPIQTLQGRYIISENFESLYTKFIKLRPHDFNSLNTYTFVLYNIETKEYSRPFTSTYQPSKCGYNLGTASIGASLKGKYNQVVKGYLVLCTAKNGGVILDSIEEFKERFNYKLLEEVNTLLQAL